MNEKEYKLFEQGRLTGMPIRDIETKFRHGHVFYQRNGYIERFKQEHPDFIETRGRGPLKGKSKPANFFNINEDEYKAFEAQKLAGNSMDDIVYNIPHGNRYYYINGYVARFNREHPNYNFNDTQKKRTVLETYEAYIEYHRKGMSMESISEQLDISLTQLKRTISIQENRQLIEYADNSLASQVEHATTRKQKFDLIRNVRDKLIAVYGSTLMDVPSDEPRLLALQLANQTLR